VISNNRFIATFSLSVPTKEYWKSVNIGSKYGNSFASFC